METIKKGLFPVNSIRLCIDRYDSEICEGNIYGVTLQDKITFHNVTDLLLGIEDAYNRIGQPQSNQVLRSFVKDGRYNPYKGNPSRYHKDAEVWEKSGAYRTLDLIMTSRQKAEWQGLIKEPDGSVRGRFRSVLECIRLLEQIL